MQSRRIPWITTLSGFFLLDGCSLVGSWCTVTIDPDSAPFPITAVTLVDDGTYCVAHASGGRARTSSGTYQWTGLKLTLNPEGGPPQTYPGYLRLDGKLVLKQHSDGRRVTAILEKQRDEIPRTPP